tara:strand:- start:11 stop:415 length:405 start_codon:yes stop_codon:yes gene_type:complete
MEEQKRKKLTKLADKMLEAHDKADALSNIETGDEFRSSVSNILDSFASTNLDTNEYIDKTKKAIALVKNNISLSNNLKNFDTDEYIHDRKTLTDILFIMQSFIGDKNNEVFGKKNLQDINDIYRKHNNINKLLT